VVGVYLSIFILFFFVDGGSQLEIHSSRLFAEKGLVKVSNKILFRDALQSFYILILAVKLVLMGCNLFPVSSMLL